MQISQVDTWGQDQIQQLKVAPHSIEAEQSVLGGLMLDNEAWDKVADVVSEIDFYRREHRLLFKQIAKLAARGTPFDVVTLCDALESDGELEAAGGLAHVGELAKNTPSAANIKAYADIVRERSVMRQLLSISTQMADKVYNPEGASSREILDEAERKVFAIAEQGDRVSGPESVKSLVPNMVDRLDELMRSSGGITGAPTHYADLDRMLSGLQKADMVIVAGRPSMGKTTFAMNIAENVAMDNDKPVLVFSMEMPKDQIMLRVMSSFGRVEQSRVRSGQLEDHDWSKIFSAMSIISDRMNMYIDDTPALNPSEIRSRARRLAREHDGLSMIVVDYLQLMQVQGKSESRVNEVSEISRSLKALAKELNVPVVALSQLSRKCEERTDKRPMMSDLRECVTGDTLVCCSDGVRRSIASLVDTKPAVIAKNNADKLEFANSELVWEVGKKPVYDVKLATGRSIKATAEHLIYSIAGWKKLGDLSIGSRVAVARFVLEDDKVVLDDSELQKYSNSDLYWDRVIDIKMAGEEKVYDLTVPGHANWLADGIVVHNSGAIEQDADVIMFVYRDEVYHSDTEDKGTAEIIIGKQRNGPIGMVRLTFLGHYCRFDDYAPVQMS